MSEKALTAAEKQQLAVDFCGLSFATPLVLLSGCVGFGEEYTRVRGFSNRDAGAVCLKGTTLEPRLGNAPHRIAETPGGMLNAIGLQNPGVDHVVRTILPELDFSETRFIANVSGSTIEEYIEVTRKFDDSPIDAIEINISCPNVKEGGVQFGNDPEMSARVVAACRAQTSKPIITKLSPNQTDIQQNARLCIEAGSDAFAVINTLMGMAIDIESRSPVIGNNQGGLSGPAIKPVALLKTHQVYQACRDLGADETINYSEEDLKQRVKELTGGKGVDVVYDSVGQATFMKSLDCLRPMGMMVSFGQASGPARQSAKMA